MSTVTEEPPAEPRLITAPVQRLPSYGATARRLGFELLIVFLGVSAALWAENRHEDEQKRVGAIRITEALLAGLQNAEGWANPYLDSVSTEFDAWKAAYARGDRPTPYFFRIPGAERGPVASWDAALASGILDVVDPNLVVEAGNYYLEIDGVLARISRYMALTESRIFPGLGERSADYFYVAGTSQLKPEFAGHMRLTEEVLAEWRGRREMGQSLRARFSEELAKLRD